MKALCRVVIFVALMQGTTITLAQDNSADNIALEEKIYYSVGLNFESAGLIDSVEQSADTKNPEPKQQQGIGIKLDIFRMSQNTRFGISLTSTQISLLNNAVATSVCDTGKSLSDSLIDSNSKKEKSDCKAYGITALSLQGYADYVFDWKEDEWFSLPMTRYVGASLVSTLLQYEHPGIDDALVYGIGLRLGWMMKFESFILDTGVQASLTNTEYKPTDGSNVDGLGNTSWSSMRILFVFEL